MLNIAFDCFHRHEPLRHGSLSDFPLGRDRSLRNPRARTMPLQHQVRAQGNGSAHRKLLDKSSTSSTALLNSLLNTAQAFCDKDLGIDTVIRCDLPHPHFFTPSHSIIPSSNLFDRVLSTKITFLKL